ncbi:MAG: hypothetical protein KF678_09645 [Phycisphaeraceae bacterium]|nr:hypothetical protein [Phycisphaeraceae bacterium]
MKVSAGYRFSLGVNSNGQIIHWGSTYHGRGNVPQGSVFVAVSAGYDHGLALDATGNVYAWGGGDEGAGGNLGQGTVPVDPQGEHIYTQIAAGEAFNLVLRSNGTIWHWGRDWEEQDEIPDNDTSAPGFIPYVAIDAGGHHGIGLKADGSIRVWGAVNYQSCTTQGVLPQFASDDVYIAVGAGHYMSYAVKADRSVVWWGCLGCNVVPPTTINGSVQFIDNGYNHGYAKTTGSHVHAWGNACSTGGTIVFAPPNEVPSFLENAIVLSVATGHSNDHNIVIIMD